MPIAVTLAFTGLIAYAIAASMVPVIRREAVHHKLLDYPDGDRRKHATPVPRLGGIAVFVGSLAALTLVAMVSEQPFWYSLENWALLAATAVLFVVGLLDDLRGVSPAAKLVVQGAAALLVALSGPPIDIVRLIPGYDFSLGHLAVPVMVLWLVGVSNAYNLIDGLDGLAGGVGVIALTAISAAALILGNFTLPVMCIALLGALLGFLKYNRPPARIFLGDSGSLVVGFLLALFAVKGATRSDGIMYGLVPLFSLSYLLLDTGIAMMRRWLRGAPLSRADGRHIHHQLQILLLSPLRAVRIIYIESAFIAALGLCLTFVPPMMTLLIGAVGAAVLTFMMVYGVRWLDYHEFLEAGASLASAMRKGRTVIRDRIAARDLVHLISHAATFEDLNALLIAHADTFRFAHMQFAFGGDDTPSAAELPLGRVWKLEYPLLQRAARIAQRAGRRDLAPVLTIWCWLENDRPHAGAERIAQILAPALTAWVLDSQIRSLPGPRTERADVRRQSGAAAAGGSLDRSEIGSSLL